MFKACEGMESLLLWVAAPRGVQQTQSVCTDRVRVLSFLRDALALSCTMVL